MGRRFFGQAGTGLLCASDNASVEECAVCSNGSCPKAGKEDMVSRKKFVFGAAALVLVVALFLVKSYANGVAAQNVNDTIARMSKIVDVGYEDVSMNLLNQDVTISNVSIAPKGTSKAIDISRVVVKDFDQRSAIPAFLSMSFEGVRMNPETIGVSQNDLQKFDIKGNVPYDVVVDYRYNVGKKDFQVNELSFDVKEIGKVKLNMHLGSVFLDANNYFEFLARYPNIQMIDAEIAYDDYSLVERIIAAEAKKKNKDPKDFKKEILKDIDQEIKSENDTSMKQNLEAMRDFVDSQKHISIKISPESPVTVQQIMQSFYDMQKIRKLLNLKIKS